MFMWITARQINPCEDTNKDNYNLNLYDYSIYVYGLFSWATSNQKPFVQVLLLLEEFQGRS